MNRKKIIIAAVSSAVVIGLIGGGIGGYRWYQNKNLTAEVQYVSNLNMGLGQGGMSSYGIVTNDMAQDVPLLEEQNIQEVFVQEGQTVAIGDPLLSYDMTMSNLKLEMKQLDIDTNANKMEAARRELEKLKNTKPVENQPLIPTDPDPSPVPSLPEEEPSFPQGPEKSGEAYHYISENSAPSHGTGTEQDPYVFLCMPDCYVLGSYFNTLSEAGQDPVHAVFEIRQGNVLAGSLVSAWKISGNSGMPILEESSRWSVATRTQLTEESAGEDVTEIPPAVSEPEAQDLMAGESQGYTAKELAKAIKEKEIEIRDLDLAKRKAELELEQMKKISADGVVKATVNGVVKKVGDRENPPADGSPFITVSGSEGLYVKGSLSELMLGKIQTGQIVYANSWESGSSFEAAITEISPYPQADNNSFGDGNPNVSYYPYTAYIENTEGLKNGEAVDLNIPGGAENASGISLDKAYIREENGRFYVLKADEKERLVKQYVQTGRTIWGQSVEILSGLTLEDRIAFPYGKTAKEGVRVKDGSNAIYK